MHFFKRITSAYLWNHLNKIVGYFLDLCLIIILARGLGSYQFGLYSELFNFVFMFTLLCSFGMDTTVSVFIPKHADNPGELSAILRRVFALIGAASVVCCLGMLFFDGPLSAIVKSPEIEGLLFLVAFYAIFFNLILIAQAVLISLYNTKFLFVTNTSWKALFIITAFALFELRFSLKEILFFFTLINFLIGLAYFIKLANLLKVEPQKIKWRSFFHFGLAAWITNFLNYLLGRYFGIFFLGYYAVSKEEIGFYNIACTLTLALSYIFTSGFGGIALTAFSELENRKDVRGIKLGWSLITKFSIFFCMPVFLFILYHAEIFIRFLYTEAYLGSANFLKIFGLFFLMSILFGSGANSTLLYSLNREKSVLCLRSLFSVFNILLSIILIPKYQALGAIIAIGFSTLGIIVAEFFYARKYILIQFPFLFATKIALASSAALALSTLVGMHDTGYVLFGSLVFGTAFIAILYVLKPLDEDDRLLLAAIDNRLGRISKQF